MKEANIFIYDVIGADFWGEGVSAKAFTREFKDLEKKHDRINVHINSPGGSVWDGLAIANTISASSKDIHTYIDGIAFSMGAIIALSGKTVHAAKNSLFLLHNVSGGAWGNANDMRLAADDMDKYDEVLINSIADKSGVSPADIRKNWFDYKDHLFTAEEAKKENLIQVIEDYAAENMPALENSNVEKIISFYSARKESGPFKLAALTLQSFQNSNKNNPTMFGTKFKSLSALVDRLKASEEVTAEDIAKVNDDLQSAGLTGLVLIPSEELTNLQNSAANAQKLVDAANKTAADAVTAAATHEAKIKELEAKLEKAPAASTTQIVPSSEDTFTTETADKTFEESVANMPHNAAADNNPLISK